MHRVFRERLDAAEGRSEFIVAVVADIRGFSAFSTHHESVETAVYIKRVYIRMIDEYFPGASFYKATGDGMLITIPYTYTEESLRHAAHVAVGGCLRCLEEFPTICEGDPMINFEVPREIGFGVARGPACCLVSGDVVLDYSGHLLNLTSRLLGLARPSGIVLDAAFGLGLLPEEKQGLFEEADVYLPGIAEETPRAAYILKGVVQLSEGARRPLRVEQWERIEIQKTVREWKLAAPRFKVDLPRKLKRTDGIQVEMVCPLTRAGRKVPGIVKFVPTHFDYRLRGNRPCVVLRVDEMVARLTEDKVPRTAEVTVSIDWVPE